MIQKSESPVAISVEQKEEEEATDENAAPMIGRKAAKMSLKQMPLAKKLAKASTSANFWKDPVMIGSAAFTLLFPLGIYFASTLGKINVWIAVEYGD